MTPEVVQPYLSMGTQPCMHRERCILVSSSTSPVAKSIMYIWFRVVFPFCPPLITNLSWYAASPDIDETYILVHQTTKFGSCLLRFIGTYKSACDTNSNNAENDVSNLNWGCPKFCPRLVSTYFPSKLTNLHCKYDFTTFENFSRIFLS